MQAPAGTELISAPSLCRPVFHPAVCDSQHKARHSSFPKYQDTSQKAPLLDETGIVE